MPLDPVKTWQKMQVKVWPEEYFLVDLPFEHAGLAFGAMQEADARYCSVTRDQFGFSLIVDTQTWARLGMSEKERNHFGPLKVLSTDSELPFDVPGFIRTAIEPVNARGLKAAPICGLRSDHFFTGADTIEEVAELFHQFSGGVRFD